MPVFSTIQRYVVLLLAMAIPMTLLYTVSALGPFLMQDLQLSQTHLSFFNIGTFGIAAVLSIFYGLIFRRLNLKYGFLISFLLVSAGFFILSVNQSLAAVVAATTLIGLSQAMCNPLTNLFIQYSDKIKNKSLAVGIKQSGVQIAALIVGVAMPLLYRLIGLNQLLVYTAVFIIVVAVYIFIFTDFPPIKQGNTKLKAARFEFNILLVYLMLIQLIVGIILATFIIYLPVYATQIGLSKTQAGFLISLFGIMGILSRLILPALANYLANELTVLTYIAIVAAFSMLSLILSSFIGNIYLYLAVIGIGMTLVAINAFAMSILLKFAAILGSVANTSGIVASTFFLGFAFGPWLSASLEAVMPHQLTIWLFCLLLCLLLYVFIIKFNQQLSSRIRAQQAGTSN